MTNTWTLPQWAESEVRKWRRSVRHIQRTYFRVEGRTSFSLHVEPLGRGRVRVFVSLTFDEMGMFEHVLGHFLLMADSDPCRCVVLNYATGETRLAKNKQDLRDAVLGVYGRYMSTLAVQYV